VTDFLDRLQQSLGHQYRLERELGGGGMSRVFLAEEIALGRRVVIKVLPPELAGMVSLERFQREVRLAAALQHPHIVPLLAAGEAGGVLYYTMPFVTGESLRARMDREGALPVTEAVRYLRDVADALAGAHAQGIVHRDIKPENVLLGHQHATVTDFGIAKALAPSDGGGSLTGTGLAIGTPAYMAPEQASGEAQTDHRADLYALGVLGYEMLAGEPPFRGGTAQALVAAHLSRTPTQLTELRPSLPPELGAVIMRCLEKRPADRFQHAAELVAVFERLVTATPASTRLTAASSPAREWSLPRVLGSFAVVGSAIVGLAWALRTMAGLPDWFFSAAAILVALGLPVTVAAAMHRHLTLRKALTGGLAALLTLGVVTAGHMGLRALGIGPAGSLVASGKLKARERLLIADFDNETRDPHLGGAVTQAFRVDFSQSALVSPVEEDYVRRVLRRMERPDSIPLSLAVAREIAQREGFKAVVGGTLQQVGPSLLISAQLVNAASGEVLASARETARDSTLILDAVDRVSKALRERIGESLRSIRDNKPLAEVTTSSLEALRKYSQALQAVSADDHPRAVALLEEAVVADSDFAMAWRELGNQLNNFSERPARAEEALTRAFRLRDRLTFRERMLAEHAYFRDVLDLPDSATAAVSSLLDEYPEDVRGLNLLGIDLDEVGSDSAAEATYRRAAALDPGNITPWANTFSIQIQQARFDSAAATLREIRRRFAPGAVMDEREVVLLLGQREFGAAEARLRELLPRYRSDPLAYGRELGYLGAALALQGKLAEADRILTESAAVYAQRGLKSEALVQLAQRTFPVAWYRGDPREAGRRLEEAARGLPLEELPEPDRPYFELTEAAVTAGDTALAHRWLAALERAWGEGSGWWGRFLRGFTRGMVLSLEKGSLPAALTEYRGPGVAEHCRYCLDPYIADAFDRLGQADSALAYLQHWADAGEDYWETGYYTYWPPIAYHRLGELYQARGDTARALVYYGKFVALWKDADAELQPRVQEAKQRMAVLAGEPRKP